MRAVLSCLLLLGITAAAVTIRVELEDLAPLPAPRPIIGVLAQEIEPGQTAPAGHTSYITASYVKWVESGGARAAPVLLGQTTDYYQEQKMTMAFLS